MTGLGTGIYTVSDVARLSNTPPRLVRAWFVDAPSRSPIYAVERVGGEPTFTFYDLITMLLVRSFRQSRISLQAVRRYAETAAEILSTDRPFARRKFYTDGRTILMSIGDGRDAETGELIDLARKQGVFRRIVAPFLTDIEYDVEDFAARWWPAGRRSRVVVDPQRSFGEPIVASGVPTRVLFGPVSAGDSARNVADWYGIERAEVLAAVRFERTLRDAA